MPQPLPLLIQALLDTNRYPHAVKSVELIETHISWLLLAGEFAYKIKKPITLPFLDYCTLAKRRRCCAQELRLNRRYAADIYLNIVPITGTAADPSFGGDGIPIEYVVKMRRFDEAGRLDHLCARGELTTAQVSALAQTAAAFHHDAAIAKQDTHFGLPEAVIAPVLANFAELQAQLTDTVCLAMLEPLLMWTQAEIKALTPLFYTRKAAGKIRECHGDLHLGNIVIIDGKVRLFDCIEFNEDLRWIDIASDIAFSYVDLIDHQQPGLGAWLLNEWLSVNGDYDAVAVLRFYAIYRALVRAKVATITSQQGNTAINTVRQYIRLAASVAAPKKLKLTITHGLAGCGKTWASTALILLDTEANTIRLRSDVERKRLFGLSAIAKSNLKLNECMYSQSAHENTYAKLHALAVNLLAAGWSVIVDAAFLKSAERNSFHALASKMNAEFGILAPQASSAELRTRILARQELGHDASEATLEVLAQQIASIEPLSQAERSYLLPVTQSV
jgi:aminoglycoside phosphotransferase family enzyme/predicted kinase